MLSNSTIGKFPDNYANPLREEPFKIGAQYCEPQIPNENTTFILQSNPKVYEHIGNNLERPFKCSQCELTFERASQLDYHQRSVHLGEKSQICQICGKRFFRKTDLKTHLNVHLGINQLSCKICGREFNHVSNLIRHSRIHEGMRPYPCSVCGKRFTQISSVVRHKRIHTRDSDNSTSENSDINQSIKRRHYCRTCGDTFPFIVLLRRHEKLHSGENFLECNDCKMKFANGKLLQQHRCMVDESPTNNSDAIQLNSERIPKNYDGNTENRSSSIGNVMCVSSGEINPTNEKTNINEKHSTPTKNHSTKSFAKRLHIEGSQLYIEVCESDYSNSLGITHQEMLDNYHQHDDSVLHVTDKHSNSQENGPTFRLVPTDLGQQLYELEMNYLSKKYLDQSRTVNALESIEHLDYQNCGLGNSLNQTNDDKKTKDELINLINKNSESSINNEETQSYNQTPMVRLVQNEEGEQFFELVRDPLDYVETNKHSHSLRINDDNENENDKKLIIERVNSKLSKKIRKKFTHKVKGQEQKYECTICRKKFSTASNLKQHAGTHFLDQQKFHCKECEISFAWKSTLNKHLASNHRPDGPQKFVCEICPKVYCTLSQVNEHVKRDHLKERNHTCEECGKSFFKKFDLKSHIRTHTKERPYICKICNKKFYHQSHIIRHERIHSGERPYSCTICQKTFTQLSSLKAHKQRHQNVAKIDILDYQNNEDDPMTLGAL